MSKLSRKAAGFPLGPKDLPPQGDADDGNGECIHRKISASEKKGLTGSGEIILTGQLSKWCGPWRVIFQNQP
jgi:hypothetical protein